MRLMRVGARGHERPVVLDAEGRAYDITPVTPRIDGTFMAGDGPTKVRDALEAGRLRHVDITGERVGAPVERPGSVVCIGLNYTDHAAETGVAVPSEPVVFLKASDTVVGPDDDVFIPHGSTKSDWEVELAVVLGGVARYLESAAAGYDVIAGYAVSHDVSEREFQLERGGQWTKGKSCETFNPLGPWLVTADEVPDPQDLGLRLWVNGLQRQNGTTKDMVFDVGYLVWYLSQFMVLEPGDVVNTGTPAGVALGLPHHPYLQAGDVVELEIDGLGRQRQTFRRA